MRSRAIIGAHWSRTPRPTAQVSPITYAANITTPLLILHSENDLRCPIGNAEDLFAILRLRKQDVELVRFPAESTTSAAPARRCTG